MMNSINKLARKFKSLMAVSVIAGMVSLTGFAHDRSETAEIVEETLLMLYTVYPHEVQRNLGDYLNCVDFCHDQFFPGSAEENECIEHCQKTISYFTTNGSNDGEW